MVLASSLAFFGIVGAIGALHRLRGLAQFIHRGFQLRRQVIQASLFHLLQALLGTPAVLAPRASSFCTVVASERNVRIQPTTVLTATGSRCGPRTMRPITNTSSSSLKPISNTSYTCSLSWRFVSSFFASSCLSAMVFAVKSASGADFSGLSSSLMAFFKAFDRCP